MLCLNDFKSLEVVRTTTLTGGQSETTAGGCANYYASYYPGGVATATWSSDCRDESGTSWNNLSYGYGSPCQ